MDYSEKMEQRILKISLVTGIIFVVLEIFMAIFSKSQSILMDAAFDGSELIVIVVSLILTPLLYKPITERRPYGYAQCESLFIIVKGFMLVSVTLSLLVSNIQVMLNGGNHVNTTLVSILEMILSILSFFVLVLLMHYGKKLNSPMIVAEIYGWKLDVICGVGVSLAFLVPALLQQTSFAWLAPYFDQIVAIILALVMMPAPIKMVWKAFQDILLFAPNEEVSDALKKIIAPICDESDFEVEFIHMLQTGRKTWISITLRAYHDMLSISELKYLQDALMKELAYEFEDVSLELIPAVEEEF